jgi:choline monooxygenase
LTLLPPEWYHDPALFGRERELIWAREWLAVTTSSHLDRPGSYVATTIAGWPVLVVRDASGAIRGFHNVCRHRAGPLVWDGVGTCTRLVCRYHGWAYGLDGELASARDFGCDPGALSLHPIRTEVWRGLVFANLDPEAPALVEALGDFAEQCADVAWEPFVHHGDADHEVAANWKTYAENYLEGYHIPLVHPALNREVDAARYEVTVGDRWCRHTAPTRSGSVNAGLWIWRWPNLALNVYPGAMNLERFVPLSPTRVRVSYSYFFAGEADDDVVAMSTTVLSEDRRICEAVQRNLEAGAYRAGTLSPRHERGVAAFQGWVRDALG